MPRQSASHEIHKDVAKGLHVISAALLDAQMGINASIAGSARQVFVFSVRNMLVCSSVSVFLGQAKVYDVYKVAFLAEPPEKKKEI